MTTNCLPWSFPSEPAHLCVTVPSEEGFVSGPVSDDDQYGGILSREMKSLGLHDLSEPIGSRVKCSSDSGASSTELDQIMNGWNGQRMKEEQNGPLVLGAVGTVPPPTSTQQMPGAWFYEVGSGDENSCSPTQDFIDDGPLGLNNLRSLLTTNRTTTETVEVPSSEHVAEIVGRQGCKIKALRAKTNTYIKTPVRGEDPLFMVTGRPEDVMEAKREIECAAEHFTQIRASRRHSQGGAPAPGHVTAYVRVPLRVVGLVVGPKGATIKRIQQDTHTYIITPSREREPIFEVTGLPLNVEAARKEIEQHIYQRTGNMPITDPSANVANYDVQSNMSSLSAAATAAARSSYGSLAATSNLRKQETAAAMAQAQQAHQNANAFDYMNNMRNPGDANVAYVGLQGLLRQYPGGNFVNPMKAYSAGASPPAASPCMYTANGPQPTATYQQSMNGSGGGNMQMNGGGNGTGGGGYAQWSSAYTSLGIGAETTTNSSLSCSSMDLFGSRSTTLSSSGTLSSGRSLWNSPFLSSADELSTISNQRDEGLGDSPPNLGNDPYHLMSSIWSDLENPRDGPCAPSAPIDSVTVYSSGISQ